MKPFQVAPGKVNLVTDDHEPSSGEEEWVNMVKSELSSQVISCHMLVDTKDDIPRGYWFISQLATHKPGIRRGIHNQDIRMASSGSVNFISLVISCDGLQEQPQPTTCPLHGHLV